MRVNDIPGGVSANCLNNHVFSVLTDDENDIVITRMVSSNARLNSAFQNLNIVTEENPGYNETRQAHHDVVYTSFIDHLRNVKGNTKEFIRLIFDVFGHDRLQKSSFVYYLSSELDMNYQNLKRSISAWSNSDLKVSCCIV